MEGFLSGAISLGSLMVISLLMNVMGRMGSKVGALRKTATKSWQKNLTDLIGLFLMFLGLAAGIIVFNIQV